MKFDKIIMNPPYDKNLHLKILSEAMKHSDEIVNLSPIRWLQDPLAEYKKNSDFKKFENIRKHIESIEELDRYVARTIFNVDFTMDIGIYKLGKGGWKYKENTIVEKVLNKMTVSLKDKLEIDKTDGWRVRLSEMRPVPIFAPNSNVAISFREYTTHNLYSWVYKDGYTKDGTHWTENVTTVGSRTHWDEKSPLPLSIKFDTEQEAINFENSTKTLFHRYYIKTIKTDMHFPLKYVPYLEDYTHPWTDELLYKYFNLTEDEIEVIENEVR